MIAKRIKQDQKFQKSAGKHIRDLADYILNAKQAINSHDNQKEKVICSGGIGFTFDTTDAQIAEMTSLAAQCPKSKNPVNHYMLSWQKNEHPSHEQIEQAVKIFLAETGLKNPLAIWGAHSNTDNIHVHIQVCRIDSQIEQIQKINNGFDKITCQRAVARIEAEQNWETEQNSLFKVVNGQLIERNNSDKISISDGARQAEQRTGELSAERRAKLFVPELLKAKNWQELHLTLKKHNAFYNLRAGGAVIRFGDTKENVKASRVARELSKKLMEEKLGFYEKPDLITKDHSIESIAKQNNFIALLILLILRIFGIHLVKKRAQIEHHKKQRQELKNITTELQKEIIDVILEVQKDEQGKEKQELTKTQKQEIEDVKKMTYEEQQALFDLIESPVQQPTTTAAQVTKTISIGGQHYTLPQPHNYQQPPHT